VSFLETSGVSQVGRRELPAPLMTTMNAHWTRAPTPPVLGEGEVHVWRLLPATVPDHLAAVLSVGERRRAAGFAFPHLTRKWSVTRGAVRCVLAAYLQIDPREVPLSAGESGKPSITGAMAQGLEFSVSHSGDLALLAACRGCEIGIDVERYRGDVDILSVSCLAFPPATAVWLATLPCTKRATAFFCEWTRLEARAKALGLGLGALLNGGHHAGSDRLTTIDLTPGQGYVAALSCGMVPSRVCWYGFDAEGIESRLHPELKGIEDAMLPADRPARRRERAS
jgi:4'-phosphopantetheinyl transferase